MRALLTAILALVVVTPALAAWYLDRDNTMEPAEPDVGDAMAVVLGPNGTVTQAIQVCSGVYLMTAHGGLDSPKVARENNRPVRENPGTRIIAYPMIPDNMMYSRVFNQYLSPRLHDPSLWEGGHENTDYVFIKVDDPKRPQSYVRPLDVTPDDLIRHRSELPVYMYRGLSRYKPLPGGGLDHSEETAIPNSDTRRLSGLYQVPQRVSGACELSSNDLSDNGFLGFVGAIGHSCPTERSASGASYISRVDGVPYLVGYNQIGSSTNRESFDPELGGGSNLFTSSRFCTDYERACGQPCVQLEDVLE